MSDRDQQSQASTSRPASPVPPLPDFSNARPYRFAWDAGTRKPGPSSVSGTSEGHGDYFTYRPALGNFNFSSTSLALGTIPSDWSSAKYGFNAISTLVNSPHKKSAPPKAHASVPPIVPSRLPRIRRKDFDAYLKAIAPDWEQFEKTVQTSQVNQVGQGDAFAAALAEMDQDQLHNEPPISPRTPRIARGNSIPSIDSVPPVYFDSNFDLSDPKTFGTVTEQNNGDLETDPSALAHSIPLLEKLSHYADTIELHLIREISLRSSSFFAALTNLNELQTESSQCLDRIRGLRGRLHDIDESGAKKGLELVRLEKRVKNLNDVREGVRTMQSIGEMLGLAGSLASGGEWEAALGLIGDLEQLWYSGETKQQTEPAQANSDSKPPLRSSKRNSTLAVVPESIAEEPDNAVPGPLKPPPPVIPLSSLNAFASLPGHLRALTADIASSLMSELVTVLRTDLLNQMDLSIAASSESTIDGISPARSERLTMLRDRLRPLIRGLRRTNTLKEAITRWSAVAFAEIRSSMKKPLPSVEELDDEDPSPAAKNGGEGSALRDRLWEMSHEEFLSLMRTIYGSLLHGVQELQTQNAIFNEVARTLEHSESSAELSTLPTDLGDLLSSAAELTHSKAAKILGVRAEKHAGLDLPRFLEIFNETWNFVIRTETICRRMIVGLRGAAVSQAKAFLQAMHQDHISQSAKFVEEEQWSATDVSSDVQALVNVIIDSAVRDSPELVVLQASPSSSPQTNGTHRPSLSSKHLNVEDRRYFAVSATLSMMALLIDYLKIIVNLPLLTTDTVGRVIEFLKAFNSRTCQVVLGAGAMRSAGLKNITAKHLALASQSLSIVTALIPYVRECFRRHLNPKQAVMLVEFDKLKRDFQEHQQEIHAKLVAIMGDRLNAHCRTLQTVDWSVSRDTVNDYMSVLVKETVTLHKVLSRYLQEAAIEFIMSQVFASINHRLSDEFGKIDLPNQEAKERLLRDARYLHQNFSNLKNVNASAGMLETVVNEKRVTQPGMVQQDQISSNPPTQASASGSPDNRPTHSAQPHAHSLAANASSTMESANERLRNIFRRSTLRRHDSKTVSDAQTQSPTAERPKSPFFPEKAPVEEPSAPSVSPPPPPTPEKLGTESSIPTPPRPSTPLSPALSERSKSKSPRPIDKALPIPLPTLDVNGNIVDPPDSPYPTENGISDTGASLDNSVLSDS